jgi:hypothetical protein
MKKNKSGVEFAIVRTLPLPFTGDFNYVANKNTLEITNNNLVQYKDISSNDLQLLKMRMSSIIRIQCLVRIIKSKKRVNILRHIRIKRDKAVLVIQCYLRLKHSIKRVNKLRKDKSDLETFIFQTKKSIVIQSLYRGFVMRGIVIDRERKKVLKLLNDWGSGHTNRLLNRPDMLDFLSQGLIRNSIKMCTTPARPIKNLPDLKLIKQFQIQIIERQNTTEYEHKSIQNDYSSIYYERRLMESEDVRSIYIDRCEKFLKEALLSKQRSKLAELKRIKDQERRTRQNKENANIISSMNEEEIRQRSDRENMFCEDYRQHRINCLFIAMKTNRKGTNRALMAQEDVYMSKIMQNEALLIDKSNFLELGLEKVRKIKQIADIQGGKRFGSNLLERNERAWKKDKNSKYCKYSDIIIEEPTVIQLDSFDTKILNMIYNNNNSIKIPMLIKENNNNNIISNQLLTKFYFSMKDNDKLKYEKLKLLKNIRKSRQLSYRALCYSLALFEKCHLKLSQLRKELRSTKIKTRGDRKLKLSIATQYENTLIPLRNDIIQSIASFNEFLYYEIIAFVELFSSVSIGGKEINEFNNNQDKYDPDILDWPLFYNLKFDVKYPSSIPIKSCEHDENSKITIKVKPIIKFLDNKNFINADVDFFEELNTFENDASPSSAINNSATRPYSYSNSDRPGSTETDARPHTYDSPNKLPPNEPSPVRNSSPSRPGNKFAIERPASKGSPKMSVLDKVKLHHNNSPDRPNSNDIDRGLNSINGSGSKIRKRPKTFSNNSRPKSKEDKRPNTFNSVEEKPIVEEVPIVEEIIEEKKREFDIPGFKIYLEQDVGKYDFISWAREVKLWVPTVINWFDSIELLWRTKNKFQNVSSLQRFQWLSNPIMDISINNLFDADVTNLIRSSDIFSLYELNLLRSDVTLELVNDDIDNSINKVTFSSSQLDALIGRHQASLSSLYILYNESINSNVDKSINDINECVQFEEMNNIIKRASTLHKNLTKNNTNKNLNTTTKIEDKTINIYKNKKEIKKLESDRNISIKNNLLIKVGLNVSNKIIKAINEEIEQIKSILNELIKNEYLVIKNNLSDDPSILKPETSSCISICLINLNKLKLGTLIKQNRTLNNWSFSIPAWMYPVSHMGKPSKPEPFWRKILLDPEYININEKDNKIDSVARNFLRHLKRRVSYRKLMLIEQKRVYKLNVEAALVAKSKPPPGFIERILKRDSKITDMIPLANVNESISYKNLCLEIDVLVNAMRRHTSWTTGEEIIYSRVDNKSNKYQPEYEEIMVAGGFNTLITISRIIDNDFINPRGISQVEVINNNDEYVYNNKITSNARTSFSLRPLSQDNYQSFATIQSKNGQKLSENSIKNLRCDPLFELTRVTDFQKELISSLKEQRYDSNYLIVKIQSMWRMSLTYKKLRSKLNVK